MYLVKWTDVENKDSCFDGFEYDTLEEVAEAIKDFIVKDFSNGISGAYIYEIVEGKLEMIDCPVPGAVFDCLHYDYHGYCKLQNPYKECDDYSTEVGYEE